MGQMNPSPSLIPHLNQLPCTSPCPHWVLQNHHCLLHWGSPSQNSSREHTPKSDTWIIRSKSLMTRGWCHGMTSLLSFLVFVCPLPHLHHLLTPSDLVCLPSTASAPTLRCTHATMLHLGLD